MNGEMEKKEGADEVKGAAQAQAAEGWLSDYFAFRMLIMGPFIKLIYILGVVLITVGAAAGAAGKNGTASILYAFLAFVLGNIAWRILCEVWIVFFRMHDTLRAIERSLERQ